MEFSLPPSPQFLLAFSARGFPFQPSSGATLFTPLGRSWEPHPVWAGELSMAALVASLNAG